jgi:hypothetical protein
VNCEDDVLHPSLDGEGEDKAVRPLQRSTLSRK